MVNSMKSRFGFQFGIDLTGGTPVFGNAQKWGGYVDTIKTLADGNLAGQASLGYLAERTLLTGANDDIDLAGALTDALGQTITVATLKALLIWNRPRNPDDAANTTDLVVGGGSNPFLGIFNAISTSRLGPIKPGGFVMIGADALAGIGAVVAGTGDILRVTNSAGATNKYVLGLIGASA